MLGFCNSVSMKLMHIIASHLKHLKINLRTASAGEENGELKQILSDFLYSAVATEIIIKLSELLWLLSLFVWGVLFISEIQIEWQFWYMPCY